MSKPLNVWIITVGEPLPLDGDNVRLYRSGILSYLMAEEGHSVTWWSSTFDHVAKVQRVSPEKDVVLQDNLTLSLLHGPGYRRNVSFRRLLDHILLAREFRKLAPTRPKPDVILVSYPTIELCFEAIRFGKKYGVPVAVDVRDLWPDSFEQAFPRMFRRPIHALFFPLNRKARRVFQSATAITGITDEIVDWAIRKGGSARRAIDRSFPFGYDASELVDEDKVTATEFWHQHGVSADHWNICFFGTLGRQFDLATVIDAARRLLDSHPEVRFILCGEGDLKGQFEQLAQDVPSVVFPGWVDRVQISVLMDMSRLGLAPYYPSPDFMMSLPNKPIEYMSAGLPVLSTIGGVLGNLLTQHGAGVVCEGADPESLAAIVAELIHDPDRVARMRTASLDLFQRRFDAQHVYADFSEYLQQIARSA